MCNLKCGRAVALRVISLDNVAQPDHLRSNVEFPNVTPIVLHYHVHKQDQCVP